MCLFVLWQNKCECAGIALLVCDVLRKQKRSACCRWNLVKNMKILVKKGRHATTRLCVCSGEKNKKMSEHLLLFCGEGTETIDTFLC